MGRPTPLERTYPSRCSFISAGVGILIVLTSCVHGEFMRTLVEGLVEAGSQHSLALVP